MKIPRKKRQVFLYPSTFNIHTAYKLIISDPPKGYIFTGQPESYKRQIIEHLKNYYLIKKLYALFIKLFKSIRLLEFAEYAEKNENADLVFSAGYIYNGKKPWVLYILDNPYGLTGYNYDIFIHNKSKIESILLSENCKKIMCANESSIEIMKKYFSSKLLEKIVLVRPAIKSMPFKRTRKDKKIQILFIGSITNPEDFYIKGGLYVVETFEKILQKYSNIELVIRCKSPKEIKERTKSNPKIRIMEETLPFEEIINLYANSDILLFPGHTYFLMAFLESMYFKLPIVTMDTYGVKDLVKDGYNGFIVKKSRNIKEYNSENYSYLTQVRSKEFMNKIKKIDNELITRLAKKVEFLIKNPNIRRRMGMNGHKLVKTKFSIEIRNKALKKVFDEALG